MNNKRYITIFCTIISLIVLLISLTNTKRSILKYVLSEGISYGIPSSSANSICFKVITDNINYDTMNIFVQPFYLRCIIDSNFTISDRKFVKIMQDNIENDKPIIIDTNHYNILSKYSFAIDENICRLYKEKGFQYLYNMYVDNNGWICKFSKNEPYDSLKSNEIENVISILQKHHYYSSYILEGAKLVGIKIFKWTD